MNDEFERRWKKRSWPNLKQCPGIYLDGLRINHENLSQVSRSPDRDLEPGLPEYDAAG
jgi:hypothetical protein